MVLEGVLNAPYPDDPAELGAIEWAAVKSAMTSAAAEIARQRDILHVLEMLTATGERLGPSATLLIHILAAGGRADWRADPVAIERLRSALSREAEEQ